mmetsp:Transcript_7950/g.26640  ORF Transcript_7950/g.26640 Transcript_7950/m.26640 type:complete len:427 (-) Transcript_7950:395-1675(-)
MSSQAQVSSEELMEWAAAEGIQVKGVRVEEIGGGRGLVASAAVSRGTVLLEAPKSCALLSSQAIARFQHLWPPAEEKDSVYHLAIELMHRVLVSPDSPWLKSLPSSLPSCLYWPPEEKAFLRGCGKIAQILDQQEKGMKEAEEKLLRPVQEKQKEGGHFSQTLFRWAVSMVLSRSFEVEMYDKKTLVMIPMVDFLNHKPISSSSSSSTSSSVQFDHQSMSFIVTAMEDYQAGEEVSICYGDKSNGELLACYGFCLEENPHEAVTVHVGMGEEDAGRELKMRMLPRGLTLAHSFVWDQDLRWVPEEGRSDGKEEEEERDRVLFSEELLLLLRVFGCEQEDLMRLPLILQNLPASSSSENSAMTILVRACKASLPWCSSEAPGGSLQEDVRRLQRSTGRLLEEAIKQAERYAQRPVQQLQPEEDDDDW